MMPTIRQWHRGMRWLLASYALIWLLIIPEVVFADPCGDRTPADAQRLGATIAANPQVIITNPFGTVIQVIQSDTDPDCDTAGRVGAILTAPAAALIGGLVGIGAVKGWGPAGQAQTEPKSDHRTCDEIYEQYQHARLRWQTAQRQLDDVMNRLERARKIHLANQTKLILRYGTEIGQLTGGGVQGIRNAGSRVRSLTSDAAGAQRPADVDPATGQINREYAGGSMADDFAAARTRGEFLAEPTAQIQNRIRQIEQAIEGLAQARDRVAQLRAEQASLNDWFNSQANNWYARHPTAYSARHWNQSTFDTPDTVALDGAPIDRSIVNDLVKDGKITPAEGAARLAAIDANLKAAADRMAGFREQALGAGWTPDLEQYLANQDPAKLARLRALNAGGELTQAEEALKSAEAIAPASAYVEKAKLKAQWTEMMNAQQQGLIPQSAVGPVSGSQRGAFRSGGARVPPMPKSPPWGGPQWEAAPAVEHVSRNAVNEGIAWLASPLTRALGWAFVGKGQSAEEIGKILRDGMDTIVRLTSESDLKQKEMDAALQEMQRLRADLDFCNRIMNSGMAIPVDATISDLRRQEEK